MLGVGFHSFEFATGRAASQAFQGFEPFVQLPNRLKKAAVFSRQLHNEFSILISLGCRL